MAVIVSALSARIRLFASDAPEQACWRRNRMPQGEKETVSSGEMARPWARLHTRTRCDAIRDDGK